MFVRPDTRPLMLALLVSLLLHALLVSRLARPLLSPPPAISDAGSSAPLAIEYRRPRPLPAPRSAPATPFSDSVEAPPSPSSGVVPTEPSPVQRPRRHLDLRIPHQGGRDPALPFPEASPRTGGTVFDQKLAMRLHALRVARHRSPRASEPTAGRVIGDRWESFLEVDGLCFRVIEADPLDSLSSDQWFPVACDSP